MADYKTTEYIVGIVYGLLSSITVPKYRHTKPTKANDAEYIVINSLPIDANVMQKCYFNINYHVKDIKDPAGPSGIADETKLQAGAEVIMAILKSVTSITYLIDFERQEVIREAALEEHYSNLRFSFKNINN